MFIFYDFIFAIFILLYIPYLTWRRKWHLGLWMRLGFFSKDLKGFILKKENIWIHAVSVGEVLAILDLIKKVKEKYPHYQIICSTVTKTGYKIAQDELKDKAVVIFAPLDFSWIVRKFIRFIQPQIYIATETEIWPNLFYFLRKKGIPIIQINGRISDKAFIGYKRFKIFLKGILDCVNVFCVQSELEKERLIKLGAIPEKIFVVGNLKFDNLPQTTALSLGDIGLTSQAQAWIAGSTHPGEEEIILDIYQKIKNEFPSLCLILAPRHVERSEEVSKLVREKGLDPLKLSQIANQNIHPMKVLIVDVIGPLRRLYSLADIVFIGKSLTVGGGQNIIEPAFFGKPTLVGPRTYNFRDIIKIFLNEKAIVQIDSPETLLSKIRELLNDPQKRQRIGTKAKELVERYQGATPKTIEIISQWLH